VGPLMVVDVAPFCEAALGIVMVGKRAHGKDLIIHAAIKALVLAAALWMVRSGVDQLDAILQKPHPELGPLSALAVAPGRDYPKFCA
jgi:hypothetical protein